MKLEFALKEKDYLTHQLYVASQSKRIAKVRLMNRMLAPAGLIILAFLTYSNMGFGVAFSYLAFGMIWFILYPMWDKKRHVKHYQKYITEHFQDKVGKPVLFEMDEEYLYSKDESSEAKIKLETIESIDEIKEAIYLRLNTAQSFIIPKDQITNLNSVRHNFKKLADKLYIPYNLNEDWVWK